MHGMYVKKRHIRSSAKHNKYAKFKTTYSQFQAATCFQHTRSPSGWHKRNKISTQLRLGLKSHCFSWVQ